MGDKTTIQWCDATANGWWGCAHQHTGCRHCYAERQAGRFGVEWGTGKPRRYIAGWRKVLACVAARAKREQRRLRVFVNDMSDLFEDQSGCVEADNGCPLALRDADGKRLCTRTGREVAVQWPDEAGWRPLVIEDVRQEIFRAIDHYARWLDFILVTKRIENVRRFWTTTPSIGDFGDDDEVCTISWYRPNVWLLYSASDEATLRAGLPYLVDCRDRCPVRGLSLEPLLGPIKKPWGGLLGECPGTIAGKRPSDYLQWVVIGGESGREARACNAAWVRALAQNCRASKIPCFVKQFGTKPVTNDYRQNDGFDLAHFEDGRLPGRILLRDPKGGDMLEWPEDLRIREYPEVER